MNADLCKKRRHFICKQKIRTSIDFAFSCPSCILVKSEENTSILLGITPISSVEDQEFFKLDLAYELRHINGLKKNSTDLARLITGKLCFDGAIVYREEDKLDETKFFQSNFTAKTFKLDNGYKALCWALNTTNRCKRDMALDIAYRKQINWKVEEGLKKWDNMKIQDLGSMDDIYKESHK